MAIGDKKKALKASGMSGKQCDKDPEVVKRQQELERRSRKEKGEAERSAKALEEIIQRDRAAAQVRGDATEHAASELERESTVNYGKVVSFGRGWSAKAPQITVVWYRLDGAGGFRASAPSKR